MSIDLNRPEHRRRPAVDQRPKIMGALEVVTADDHDSFFQILACVQNELGEAGHDIAESWAQRQKESRAKEFKDVWRSLGQGRGLGIGTLYAMAEDQSPGWRYDAPLREMSPEEVDARRRSKAEADRKNAEEAERVQAMARERSAAIKAAAQPPRHDHPYLVQKGVSPAPTMLELDAAELQRILGYTPQAGGHPLVGRVLVIPLERFGETGPCSIEMIDESGRKSALAGPGTKSGAHGRLDGFEGVPEVVLVGEGAATVLSALEALSGQNAAAFMTSSDSNIPKVAQAIRAQYPATRIIILADLVKATGEPNQKAVEASRDVDGCFLAVPGFGPGRKYDDKDFNDLHALEGLGAVRACVEAASVAQVASIWDTPVDIAALLATQPEPMKWLVRDKRSDPPAPIIPFARGGVCTALGGTGKTALLKVLAMGCVTRHLPIEEWRIERTGKVVLVLTEDTHAEFHEDLHRLCQGMTTREREAVTRDMIVYPLAGEDTRLLIKNERGVVEKSALYHALVAKIKAIGGVVLVGLDPALGITEGDEMSQTDQRALGRAVDDLAVNVCATCILLSHSGKAIAGAEELSSHSSRGGGALTDAVRFEFTMRGMTKKEASAHGIEDLEERLHLVQITCTKGNRVPPSAKVPVWLRFDRGVLVSAGLAEPEKKAKADGTKLPKSASLAFEAIKEATMEHGQIDDATGRPYVAMDDIRSTHKDLYSQRNPANGDRAERKALQDGTSKLVELGWIKSDGLTVTFSGPGMEAHVQNILTAMAERRGRNCGTERNFSEFCSAKGTETAEQTGTSPLYKGSSCSEKFRGDFDQGRKENSERVATKPPIHDTPDGPMTFSLDALTGEPLEVQP